MPISSGQPTLPAGPHSALAADGDLCVAPLYMPTTITGHNGAVLTQRIRITVSGCEPQIRVISKKAGRGQAKLSVSVPSAGVLRATGNGIAKATAKAGKAGTVKLMLKPSQAMRKLLSKHPRRRLEVNVKLRFTSAGRNAISTRSAVLID